MHYSTLLGTLSATFAAAQVTDWQTVYTTAVNTVVVTENAAESTAQAAQYTTPSASSFPGHGHGHRHHWSYPGSAGVTPSGTPSSTPAASSPYSPPSSSATPSSAPYFAPASSATPSSASSAAAPSSTSSSGGDSSSGGCPQDTSGQHTSPGVNGAPDKSMIDSINYIRRLYNSNANCLQWSDSLASASQTCADDSSESHLRVNSDIVSAPGYDTSAWYDGDLASSEFERSMIWMLCQSPDDPELKGTCSGKTGEAGCSSGACTGHHDAIVDAPNSDMFMGCGSSSSTSWLSCSFSATQDAPSGYGGGY